jgi:hypothetical protein
LLVSHPAVVVTVEGTAEPVLTKNIELPAEPAKKNRSKKRCEVLMDPLGAKKIQVVLSILLLSVIGKVTSNRLTVLCMLLLMNANMSTFSLEQIIKTFQQMLRLRQLQ